MAGVTEEDVATPFMLKGAGSSFVGRSGDVFGGLDALEHQHFIHERTRVDTDDNDNLRSDDDDDDGFVEASASLRSKSEQQKKGDDRDVKCDLLSVGESQPERGEPDKCSLRETERDSGHRDSLSGDSGHRDSSSRDSVHRNSLSGDSGHTHRDSGHRDSLQGKDRHWHSQGRLGQRPDSQFRRPRGRAPGVHNWVPDHKKRPQHWTYYSLEDVMGSDMSEKSNTQAALAFLEDRRRLREQQEREEMGVEGKEVFDAGSGACSKGLFSFSKRSRISTIDRRSSSKDQAVAEGLDRVMPGDCAMLEASSEWEQGEASGKSTITREDEASSKSTITREDEASSKLTITREGEASGKSTLTREGEASGKSTITREGEASGKSTITKEDEASSKSTITKEDEASGKLTLTSVEEDEATKPTFKSRKGIRRNIRCRDDD